MKNKINLFILLYVMLFIGACTGGKTNTPEDVAYNVINSLKTKNKEEFKKQWTTKAQLIEVIKSSTISDKDKEKAIERINRSYEKEEDPTEYSYESFLKEFGEGEYKTFKSLDEIKFDSASTKEKEGDGIKEADVLLYCTKTNEYYKMVYAFKIRTIKTSDGWLALAGKGISIDNVSMTPLDGNEPVNPLNEKQEEEKPYTYERNESPSGN